MSGSARNPIAQKFPVTAAAPMFAMVACARPVIGS